MMTGKQKSNSKTRFITNRQGLRLPVTAPTDSPIHLDENQAGPVEGGTSTSSNFQVGEMVMSSYDGKRYQARILEISTKHEIDRLNSDNQKKRVTKGVETGVKGSDLGGGVDTGTPPKMDEGTVVDNNTTETTGTDITLFYIHYMKWNKKWDQWVPIERLSKGSSKFDIDEPENIKIKMQGKRKIRKSIIAKDPPKSCDASNDLESKKLKLEEGKSMIAKDPPKSCDASNDLESMKLKLEEGKSMIAKDSPKSCDASNDLETMKLKLEEGKSMIAKDSPKSCDASNDLESMKLKLEEGKSMIAKHSPKSCDASNDLESKKLKLELGQTSAIITVVDEEGFCQNSETGCETQVECATTSTLIVHDTGTHDSSVVSEYSINRNEQVLVNDIIANRRGQIHIQPSSSSSTEAPTYCSPVINYDLTQNLINVLLVDRTKIKDEHLVVTEQTGSKLTVYDLLADYITSIRSVEQISNNSKIQAELFVMGLEMLTKEHLVNKLLYNEESATIMKVISKKEGDHKDISLTKRLAGIYVLRLLTVLDELLHELFCIPDAENCEQWQSMKREKWRFIGFLDAYSSQYFPLSVYGAPSS